MKFDFDRIVRSLRIILVFFFCCWALIWFSIRADRKSEVDRNFGERTLVLLRDIPSIVSQLVSSREPQELLLESNLEIRQLGKLEDCDGLNDELFLLHYRYLGKHTGKVYLQNIKSGEIAESWDIPLKEMFDDLQALRKDLSARFADQQIPVNLATMVANNIPSIQVNAPVIGEDFSLFSVPDPPGYLYKVDRNSELAWKSEDLVHHSIELDDQGNVWTCSVDWECRLAKAYRFRDDAILCLGSDGEKRSHVSLTQILTDNSLFEELVAATPSYMQPYGLDPYHLNDVLPVTEDGKFWKKGDLFLSIRNKSIVMQYRPENGTVVWHQQGPWLAQHDINIVHDSAISVFNNNVMLPPEGLSRHGELFEQDSNIARFSFEDGTTEFFARDLFVSRTEGRQIQTVDGTVLVEVTEQAVYILVDSAGNPLCRFYIPYYADSAHAMHPNWNRLYLRDGSGFVPQ